MYDKSRSEIAPSFSILKGSVNPGLRRVKARVELEGQGRDRERVR